MESMVEENGSAVDPLSQGSQSGDAAPAIATSVQSLDRTHQQQTHHLVASTSIVQLTLPSSGTTQVYRRLSCVSMSDIICLFISEHAAYRLFVLYRSLLFLRNISMILDIRSCIMLVWRLGETRCAFPRSQDPLHPLDHRTLGVLPANVILYMSVSTMAD